MLEATGLRRRATGTAPSAPARSASPTSPMGVANDKEKVLLKAVDACHPATSRRFVSLLTMSFLVLVALVVGMGVGMVATIQVMCTWKYPRLDGHLHKIIGAMGLKVNIEIDEGDDEEDEEDEVINSCTKDQPLLERRENVLDADTFKKVQECLIDHPMITQNHLNPEGFNGTRGFVINFSGDGVDTFTNEKKFNCGNFNPLLPFFHAARHPETNGFVMNVLVCDKPTSIETMSVGEHVDDTLSHNKVRDGYC